jgi:hypothetical protein
MSNTAKRNAKAHAILKAGKGDEPTTSIENYKIDLTKALVWYNNNEDDKVKRNWVNSYLTKTNRKGLVSHFNDAPDYVVRQLGVICRLKLREQYLDIREEQWIENKITEITDKNFKKKKIDVDTAPVVPTASIQDRMEEKARELAGEIEGAIDDFAQNKKTDFSTKNYLAANEVAGPIAKRIGEFYVGLSKELAEAIAGDDEQLVEGYSNFSKRELKKFAEFVDGIISDCQQQVQSSKANRAPRKRKEVSPTKMVSKMKILKEFAELNLKSVNATNIIGSSEVWFYNTKYRRIGVYKGENGGTVSVKGTTIIGIDVKESKQWTLRKPEEFFKGLSLGKRALNSAVKSLTTKPATPNGRFNEETILLGAF